MQRLAEVDPDVAKALREEAQRQNRNLELIASENFVSEAVLEAAGSVLTNKYAEGYPGRRYYGGCEVVDVVEDLAIARAKELFGAEHANVQPHSSVKYTAMLACAPECGWTLACSAPNSSLARAMAKSSTTSTTSQPP